MVVGESEGAVVGDIVVGARVGRMMAGRKGHQRWHVLLIWLTSKIIDAHFGGFQNTQKHADAHSLVFTISQIELRSASLAQQPIPKNNKRYPQDAPGHNLKVFLKNMKKKPRTYFSKEVMSHFELRIQNMIGSANACMSKIGARTSLVRP